MIFGLIPGDTRLVDTPPGNDPTLQLLIGLTLASGGGGFPALGRYIMQDGDPTNEILAIDASTQATNSANKSMGLSQEMVKKFAEVSTQNPESQEAVIGLWRGGKGYSLLGDSLKATYLNMPKELYRTFQKFPSDFEKVNMQFIQNGIDQGKTFLLETPYNEIVTKYTYTNLYKEVMYLLDHGYKLISDGAIDKLVPK